MSRHAFYPNIPLLSFFVTLLEEINVISRAQHVNLAVSFTPLLCLRAGLAFCVSNINDRSLSPLSLSGDIKFFLAPSTTN